MSDHRVRCFLAGGRFSGDSASIVAPPPELMYVVECDGSCKADKLREGEVPTLCGMPTHWHDIDELDTLGDAPRNGRWYVLGEVRDAASGMEAALYLDAGHDRPTRNELANFRRRREHRARRLAASDN